MNVRLLLCGAAAVVALSCEPNGWGPKELGKGHTSQVVRDLQLGRELYATYCAGCHGEKGDGAGPAARFLDPRPRDFRLGRLKFANVSSGEVARDEDYLRVITDGLSGTAMPSFRLLPEGERLALVGYVKSFYPGWKDDPPGALLSAGQDPFAGNPAAGVKEGNVVYHVKAKCWSCHPAYEPAAEIARLYVAAALPAPELRPRGAGSSLYNSETKDSQWGAPIRAPDFLTDRIKTGLAVDRMSQIIGAGVGGTAMPTWAGALPPKQIWGLAYYVRSLSLLRGTPAGRNLHARLLGSPAANPKAKE
jgi:mono/diheme cytochrome c family protein